MTRLYTVRQTIFSVAEQMSHFPPGCNTEEFPMCFV